MRGGPLAEVNPEHLATPNFGNVAASPEKVVKKAALPSPPAGAGELKKHGKHPELPALTGHS